MTHIKPPVYFLLAVLAMLSGANSYATDAAGQGHEEAASSEAKYSIDSKIGDILDDPEAKEVLISYWPKATNPMISAGRNLTLREASQYSISELSEETLEQINEGLATMELNPLAE